MTKTWQVVLATIAIFVAGLVTGGATALGIVGWNKAREKKQDVVAAPVSTQPATQNPGGRGGPLQGFGPQLLRNFAFKLDLTPEQKARIMPIVRRTAAQLQRERREVQLATALEIERMQDEISQLLTPEQRVKFEDLIRKQRERFQQLRRQPAPAESGGAADPTPSTQN